MEVILFYAMLIGGIGLAVALYAALLLSPVGLIAYRFGWLAAAGFAAVMAGVMYSLFEPPFNGSALSFAPAGMRPMIYLNGLVQEPPIASLAAGTIIAVVGLIVVAGQWLLRRATA